MLAFYTSQEASQVLLNLQAHHSCEVDLTIPQFLITSRFLRAECLSLSFEEHEASLSLTLVLIKQATLLAQEPTY